MVPAAKVRHLPQPFFPERFRQGYDRVAACWADPALRETAWLKLGPLAAPLFYAENVWLDWRRLHQGRRDLAMTRWQALLAVPLFPLFRLVDFAGMLRALLERRVTGGSPPA